MVSQTTAPYPQTGITSSTDTKLSANTDNRPEQSLESNSLKKSNTINCKDKFLKTFNRNNYGAPFPVNRSWRDEHYPSWWEFIQYLLNTSPGSYDEHWKPASLYCSVCSKSLEYNHILHFENIETEEAYLAKILVAEELIHQRYSMKILMY